MFSYTNIKYSNTAVTTIIMIYRLDKLDNFYMYYIYLNENKTHIKNILFA